MKWYEIFINYEDKYRTKTKKSFKTLEKIREYKEKILKNNPDEKVHIDLWEVEGEDNFPHIIKEIK